MIRVLFGCILLSEWHSAAMAQTKPDTTVQCASDSVIKKLQDLLSAVQFNRDSSFVDWLPDSLSSDLGAKARIIRDQRVCRRAHQAYLRDAVENESHPDRVAVARVGSFYFIYEDDFGMAVVDRRWRHVAVLTGGL
jgi:hypothetical protein